MRSMGVVSIGLCVVAACSCGAERDPDLVTAWQPLVGEAECTAFADKVIASFVSCALPSDISGAPLRARFIDACLIEGRALGSGVTPESLTACAEARAKACDPYAPCAPVTGALRDGARCGRDSQCVGRLCAQSYDRVAPVGCGTCAKRDETQPCAYCPAGQFCSGGSYASYTHACADAVGLDGVCKSGDTTVRSAFEAQCRYGLACVEQPTQPGSWSWRFTCRPGAAPAYSPPVDPASCRAH